MILKTLYSLSMHFDFLDGKSVKLLLATGHSHYDSLSGMFFDFSIYKHFSHDLQKYSILVFKNSWQNSSTQSHHKEGPRFARMQVSSLTNAALEKMTELQNFSHNADKGKKFK